jgi:hypothetical protein
MTRERSNLTTFTYVGHGDMVCDDPGCDELHSTYAPTRDDRVVVPPEAVDEYAPTPHEPRVPAVPGPERDAHWREVRHIIAFGALSASAWGPVAGEDPTLLDDLTDQYLAQDDGEETPR